MTRPAMLKDDSLDTEERCPRGDLIVGDAVLSTYAKDSFRATAYIIIAITILQWVVEQFFAGEE